MSRETDNENLLTSHSENDDLARLTKDLKEIYGLSDIEPQDAVEVTEGQELKPWSIDGKHQLGGQIDVKSSVDQKVPPEIISVTSRVLRINLGDYKKSGFASALPTTREVRKTYSIREKAA